MQCGFESHRVVRSTIPKDDGHKNPAARLSEQSQLCQAVLLMLRGMDSEVRIMLDDVLPEKTNQ
jgi:hypothetical protein